MIPLDSLRDLYAYRIGECLALRNAYMLRAMSVPPEQRRGLVKLARVSNTEAVRYMHAWREAAAGRFAAVRRVTQLRAVK